MERKFLIKVKVFPDSGEELIINKGDNGFEVKVKEKPIQGQANRAVIRVLSGFFNVSENKVRLIRGFRQSSKIFEIIK